MRRIDPGPRRDQNKRLLSAVNVAYMIHQVYSIGDTYYWRRHHGEQGILLGSR